MGLRLGIRVANDLFVQKDFAGHVPAVRYAVELLGRERPIARDGQRMAHLRESLEQICGLTRIELLTSVMAVADCC